MPQGQRTSHAQGAGGWVWEFEPRDPKPAPLRTVAWLMWHLSEMCLGRADWTNGEHRIRPQDVPCEPTADKAVAQLKDAVARWRCIWSPNPGSNPIVAAHDDAAGAVQ